MLARILAYFGVALVPLQHAMHYDAMRRDYALLKSLAHRANAKADEMAKKLGLWRLEASYLQARLEDQSELRLAYAKLTGAVYPSNDFTPEAYQPWLTEDLGTVH